MLDENGNEIKEEGTIVVIESDNTVTGSGSKPDEKDEKIKS